MKRVNDSIGQVEGGDRVDDRQQSQKKGKLSRRKAKKFQVRAHSNPFSNVTPDPPEHPGVMQWSHVFPRASSSALVPTVLDVGCGYGGFLEVVGRLLPKRFILGLEIRSAVVEYVEDRLQKMGDSAASLGVLHCNAMTDMPALFSKAQITHMFILFADPHYKKKNIKHRVISPQLLDEYAYVLAPGGLLYVASDVADLFQWETKCLDDHPLFHRLDDTEQTDQLLAAVVNETDEAIKVKKAGKPKPGSAVYRRVQRE